MELGGQIYSFGDTYDSIVTIPDCFVVGKNKIGTAHGEAKLYLGNKDVMRPFFGDTNFCADCFLLKQDLLDFLYALKDEYTSPTFEYTGRDSFGVLWQTRLAMVSALPDVIRFKVRDQVQIVGPRGYVNSDDEGYQVIRNLALPLASYISIMRVVDKSGHSSYYWKLFVDFDAIANKKSQPLVFTYGKKDVVKTEVTPKPVQKKESRGRVGQDKYREALLQECPYCPITMVNDERLLTASHIKPWAVSSETERVDPKNGFMLSPLYDRLFDQGFITFTNDKKMRISNWLAPKNCERLNLKQDLYIPRLPLDDERIAYLDYHRTGVFKG